MHQNDFLSFTKKERGGIFALILLLLLVIILPRAINNKKERILVADASNAVKVLTAAGPSGTRNNGQNTGFVAASNDSAAKQYGRGKTYLRKEQHAFTERRWDTRRQKIRKPVEINSADTSAFIALPGIGSKLAGRIVLFRQRLGGFAHVEQVSEVYGLRDSTYQLIKSMLSCNPAAVKKIDINSATREALRVHPYIKWNIADAIVNYRSSHGDYRSVHDLARLHILDSAIIYKLEPYLTF